MKKLNSPLNVDFINRTFFKEYKDVSVINQGECFLWAYIAYRLYKNVELWDMASHAFVRDKVSGKFYDSEKPNGEEDWKDLPATNFGHGYGYCEQPIRKFSTAGEFRNYWEEPATRYNVKWNRLHRKIKRVIEKNT